MRVFAAVAAVACVAGCGGDLDVPPDDPLVARLAVLPGVSSVERMPTLTAGYEYLVLRFEQPVDHDDPTGPTFLQKVSLLHGDAAAPMVEYTTGYWDYYEDRPSELAYLLRANQVSIEHRFFGESRPDPADWSKLTIAQMAHDQHRITAALRQVYEGAFLAAGASKGGMTASYYRRFYPDDVEGTVPYVAPISFGAPDTRYATYLDAVGPSACRDAVRAVATEMLANRRAALLARASQEQQAGGLSYTRIALGPALESSIASLEWAFWQYLGVARCGSVPAATASDDELWAFLEDVSPVSDNTDDRIAQFDAYFHQAYHQLGYPDGGAAYLDPYLQYGDADYAGALPDGQPAYDGGAAMADVDQWIRQEGSRFLFVYGEWDPWTGGRYELGGATDSLRLTEPQGTHAARLTLLDGADMAAAFARLEAWTGVAPRMPSGGAARAARELPPPRVPPAIRRAVTPPAGAMAP